MQSVLYFWSCPTLWHEYVSTATNEGRRLAWQQRLDRTPLQHPDTENVASECGAFCHFPPDIKPLGIAHRRLKSADIVHLFSYSFVYSFVNRIQERTYVEHIEFKDHCGVSVRFNIGPKPACDCTQSTPCMQTYVVKSDVNQLTRYPNASYNVTNFPTLSALSRD